MGRIVARDDGGHVRRGVDPGAALHPAHVRRRLCGRARRVVHARAGAHATGPQVGRAHTLPPRRDRQRRSRGVQRPPDHRPRIAL